jgi:hypothetical protein
VATLATPETQIKIFISYRRSGEIDLLEDLLTYYRQFTARKTPWPCLFCGLMALQYILPNPILITEPPKTVFMIRISFPGACGGKDFKNHG